MAQAGMTVTVVDTDHLDRLKQQLNRVETKLDKLIAALAEGGDDDEPERSLDDGRVIAERDGRRGLG